MDRYAVFGNPVAHSLSPRIHRAFAQQTGQQLDYDAILAPEDGFAAAVSAFRQAGGRGANVTLPFKQQACALADTLSERARQAGAANTLIFHPDGRCEGDNTDGVGLVRDLTRNLGLGVTGRRLLLLGAGGAARGVLAPLLDLNPARLLVANRTASKAHALVEALRIPGRAESGSLDEIEGEFDLVINATSSGITGAVPPINGGVIAPGGVCYDMLYGTDPTPFVRWARTHGAAMAEDGLGMLVEQAAESFLRWRGVRPETVAVIEELRAGSKQ